MDGMQGRTGLRAAQVTAAGEVSMVEAPLPEPGEGEVRVKLEGCGVCASNLGPWAGPEWMSFPLEPGELGHEAWGVIDAVGAGVDEGRLGERVAALGFRGYATHDVVPADAAIPLPAALEGRPVPAEPLACGVMIFERAQIRPGDTVAIIGIGFLGALLTSLSARAGARVIAISRRAESLDMAREMGAAETVPMEDHWTIMEEVRGLTCGDGADITIECTGHQWPLDLAAEITRESGRLVIAGYHQDGPRQVNMQTWNWRAFDIVNAHERSREKNLAAMRRAVEMLATGELQPDRLYTHRYGLEDVGAALDATRDKPEGFIKALVVMG
ncbi:MDR/zinc-dependent alcohol dehydrogenase-like family protein [Pseudoroseicyclus tamaricis]|uniref:Zinc-binding dehydrogenase n=1 Tax=Pseudoroseicyclus tamaricis TaxID=2705421 RepID=A0A6B2JPC6_9RHOB|nr:zinc-binding dehydrogenase [Pseudoroseicyclus tamaricis]NDU99794.1 zinc-binding dehydrogenase [Pseudoroseicyclus tamaricis]